MSQYGGINPALSGGIAGLLVGYLSLFPAAFAAAVAVAVRRFGARGLLLSPAAWVATELARTLFFGGFPWALVGYTQTTVLPVAQSASVVGVYGVSFLVVLVSASLAMARWRATDRGWLPLRSRRCWSPPSPSGGARASRLAPDAHGNRGPSRTRAGRRPAGPEVGARTGGRDSRAVSRLEPAGGRPGRASHPLARIEHAVLLRGQPEERKPSGCLRVSVARRCCSEATRPTAGIPRVSYNSAFMVRPDGSTAGVYRKVRLVPFGEYVPFRPLLFFAAPLVEAVGEFAPGDAPVMLPLAWQAGEHGHLLRSGVPCADSSRRARGQHPADDDHQRCLVRPFVGAVSALRDGVDARRSNRGATSRGLPTRASAASSIRTGAC